MIEASEYTVNEDAEYASQLRAKERRSIRHTHPEHFKKRKYLLKMGLVQFDALQLTNKAILAFR